MARHTPVLSYPDLSRKRRLLLAIIALALASLACISAELHLEVIHQEGQSDTLEVLVQRTINETWVTAASQVNQDRKADFAAAGRSTDTENLLPIRPEDFGDLMDPGIYQDQGFVVTSTDRGLSAEKTIPLDQTVSSDEWKVKIIKDPNHPEQIIYRAKIFLDLTEMEGSVFELRNQPLPAKPNLTPGSSSGSSGGGLSGLGGIFDGMSAAVQEELAVEMWYVQKAMQMSDPIEYIFSIELPGTILLHKINGESAGTVDGNKVTLVLDEPGLMAYAGQKVVFHVESVLLDCSLACNEESQPHLIWDGDEEGVSCNCVCEEGYTVIEGERACVNCDSVCSRSDPNLVTDLEACEVNKCGCKCKEGYQINNAGTKCITKAEAQTEDNQRTENDGPSRTEISDVVTNLILGMDVGHLSGWFLLTSDEREDLLDLVEMMGVAVDHSNLPTSTEGESLTDQLIRQNEEEQNRLRRLEEIAIGQLEDAIDDRRRIQQVIIDEIGGFYWVGDHITRIPDYITKFFQTSAELAEGYIKGELEGAVKDRLLEETHGGSPATMEDAAAELVKQLPFLATRYTVDDYYLYKGFYQKHCQGVCQGEQATEAHQKALKELQNNLEASTDRGDAGRIDWSKPGDAYDRAFPTLIKLGK